MYIYIERSERNNNKNERNESICIQRKRYSENERESRYLPRSKFMLSGITAAIFNTSALSFLYVFISSFRRFVFAACVWAVVRSHRRIGPSALRVCARPCGCAASVCACASVYICTWPSVRQTAIRTFSAGPVAEWVSAANVCTELVARSVSSNSFVVAAECLFQ